MKPKQRSSSSRSKQQTVNTQSKLRTRSHNRPQQQQQLANTLVRRSTRTTTRVVTPPDYQEEEDELDSDDHQTSGIHMNHVVVEDHNNINDDAASLSSPNSIQSTDQHVLAEEDNLSPTGHIDLNVVPKPFKKPKFRSKLKQFKSAKQLLSMQAQLAAELDAKQLDLNPDDTKKLIKSNLPKYYPQWMRVRAPPPTRPLRKFCDITGLPTNYTDPVTGLYFYDLTVYQYLKSLPQARVQKCLGVRNKITII